MSICFLAGMMLLSELAKIHGVFDWLAAIAVKQGDGSPARLFTLIYGVGTIVTIFMSNDATAVVLTPAVLTAVKRAQVKPLPYLLICALIANAASFVCPYRTPPTLLSFIQQCRRCFDGWKCSRCHQSYQLQLPISCCDGIAATRWPHHPKRVRPSHSSQRPERSACLAFSPSP